MSGNGKEAATRPGREPGGPGDAEALGRALGLNVGWTVLSYLIAGLIAYGGIGWLVGRVVHVPLLFPIGMLAGLGISIGYIIHRFGRGGLGDH